MAAVHGLLSKQQILAFYKVPFLVVVLWILFNHQLSAQISFHIKPDTTIFHSHLRNAWIMPTALIGAGLITSTDNEIFDRYEIREERNSIAPTFRTHADDYLQFAPIATVVALNIAGVRGRHDPLNQALLVIKSELIMTAIVLPLKKLTRVPRPDTGAPTSFPSGHTAQAFVAATFLHLEYGKDYPVVSILGYTTAAGIGVLRVMNNRHWASDVFAGAGIGILSTNIAYLTHQNRWGHRSNLLSKAMLMPAIGNGSYGIFASFPL